jgi:hypothetical protein
MNPHAKVMRSMIEERGEGPRVTLGELKRAGVMVHVALSAMLASGLPVRAAFDTAMNAHVYWIASGPLPNKVPKKYNVPEDRKKAHVRRYSAMLDRLVDGVPRTIGEIADLCEVGEREARTFISYIKRKRPLIGSVQRTNGQLGVRYSFRRATV